MIRRKPVSNRGDAFEVFRASDPVDESTVPDGESPEARALFTQITATPRTQPETPDRKPRRRFAVAVVIALLSATTIAAAWLIVRAVSDPISVACYQDARRDSDVVAVASGGSLEERLCEPVWEDGVLVNDDVTSVGQVPPLVGCVTDQGNLAVFSSDDPALCQELGLAQPDQESTPEGDVLRQLNDELVAHFDAQDCQPIEAAREDVRRILNGYALDDWQIQISPGGPDRPCASFGLDAPNQTVHLISIPQSG